MHSRTDNLSPRDYAAGMQAQHAFHQEFLKTLEAGQRNEFRKFAPRPRPRTDEALMRFETEQDERFAKALLLMKNQLNFRLDNEGNHDALRKAGISTQSGFNFYDLRPLDLLMYPVNTPLRNIMAREGPVNAGVGTSAHWKGTTDVGTQPISIPEGFRAPIRTPNEIDFNSVYKEFGVDSSMTFTAEWAGEGFDDNLATDHLRALQSLWLGEEGMILHGNCGTSQYQGTAGNGFQLGTPATPVLTEVASPVSTLTSGTYVAVCVVMLTSMGLPATNQYGYGAAQSVSGGIIPSQRLQSAVGESYTMAGGSSAVSLLGALTTSGQLQTSYKSVTATVTNKPGAFGYAWFVSTNATPTTANAYLYAITTVPKVSITSAPNTANQTANAAGLNADNSATALDFAGLLPQCAWAANNYTWPKGGSQWNDLGGASFTAAGHGQVKELEDAFEYAFANWQTGYTDIWCSHDVARSLSAAIVASGTAYTGVQIISTPGQPFAPTTIVNGYPNRYAVDSPNGAGVLPIRTHPMLPPGTMYLALNKNPYPQSRIGNVLAALIQRDYYSIEWPVTSRDWTYGTYVQYVLAHRLPWIPQVYTNVGTYTGQ
jgi:hypothetical protein